MGRISIFIVSFMLSHLFLLATAEQQEAKQGLIQFMENLSGEIKNGTNFGWNSSSDPCTDKWQGVDCDKNLEFVRFVFLDRLNLSGTLDAASICKATHLEVLSLINNNIQGALSGDISNCRSLTHLQIGGNGFSGPLPASLSNKINLIGLIASFNNFTGEIPDMTKNSALITFNVNNNQLSGGIPKINFSNLSNFNVSNNNLVGPIPSELEREFSSDSYLGNPGLCGNQLPNACP